jgi:hypothetical protein
MQVYDYINCDVISGFFQGIGSLSRDRVSPNGLQRNRA